MFALPNSLADEAVVAFNYPELCVRCSVIYAVLCARTTHYQYNLTGTRHSTDEITAHAHRIIQIKHHSLRTDNIQYIQEYIIF